MQLFYFVRKEIACEINSFIINLKLNNQTSFNLENAYFTNFMEETVEIVDLETEEFYDFIRRHLVIFC
jgi:hypothetical protein